MSPAPTAPEIRARLAPHLEPQGALPPGWEDRLAAYLSYLLDRNRTVNLVSRASAERVLEDQLLPSLAAVLCVPAGASLTVLDVGSGGGFPGIPLAIVRPEARIDLVDATRKKVSFLADAVRELGLQNVGTHWCRIEEPDPDLLARAPFDRILARAVGAAPRISAAVRPLLAEDGQAWRFGPPGAGGRAWPIEDPRTALVPMELAHP